ncbi:McrB family protein [Halomicrobium salinisoli]|uniref:McrB family protein n=1 Tax=Halomicrobium salinisoli TaxID=2878391 RepID=UPI001CEFDA09|nr:AAA family ATPase [Halomicrobium salinisoli]
MTEAYFIHTNRQHGHPIDFERLFEDVSVAATFADKSEYGEQLQPLNEGDRVLMYDQPSGTYVGIGTVSEPWSGEGITDPEKKVAPDDDVEEFHAGVDWEHWRHPSNGYNREEVDRILEYDETYAPPQSVMPISNPNEQAINRVYSIICDGGEVSAQLTSEQQAVLEEWREVAVNHTAGEKFDFEKHDRTKDIRERADAFIDEPTPDRFKSMWDRMHAAIQRGNAENILSKWDSSTDALADLIKEIRDADYYDDQWESELGGKTTVRELFGNLHIEEYPIINAATESGLAFFDYEQPDSYTEGVEKFEDFLQTYERVVGHATAEADHGLEVPIRIEVDQLFNVIDKVDESSIENESSDAAIRLYQMVLDAKTDSETDGSDGSATTLKELAGTDANAFWVNQGNQAEIRDGYLRAKVDNDWHHDLKRVAEGDVIFHNFDDELIGYSIATGVHETYSFRDQQYQRIDVDFHWFDEPLPVDSELKETLGQKQYRTEKYYPIDSNDHLAQAYLAELSDAAANFLLSRADVEQETSIGPTELPSKPDSAAEIERQLVQNKQVIFYGPPGTGKTFDAKRFAKRWVHEETDREPETEQLRSVTFHPSFSYEDFIEGLTADATESGSVTYDVEDGVLKHIAEDATDALKETSEDENPPPFVLIIDEINRGNLAQIFGEVITLLEADKRGNFEVELAHSGDSFTLPPNLYIIGTMNTADQSISLVDTALRRRFRFIDFPPDVDVVFEQYDSIDASMEPEEIPTAPSGVVSDRDRLVAASVLAIDELNDRILDAPQLGKGKQLGHTYLLEHDSLAAVVDAWRFDILPQLEEYYFGQFDRLREDLLDETGETLFEWDTERIQPFTASELYTALCTLGGVENPVELSGQESQSTAETSSESADDAWGEGERTPEAFRDRVSSTLDPANAEKISELLDAGDEIARLDPGNGDHASLMLKAESVNPSVGIIQIEQDGTIGFRWDWIVSNDNNRVSPAFVDDAATVFESVPGYQHEWDPEDGENGDFESPELAVQDLAQTDIDDLIESLREFVDLASEQ